MNVSAHKEFNVVFNHSKWHAVKWHQWLLCSRAIFPQTGTEIINQIGLSFVFKAPHCFQR